MNKSNQTQNNTRNVKDIADKNMKLSPRRREIKKIFSQQIRDVISAFAPNWKGGWYTNAGNIKITNYKPDDVSHEFIMMYLKRLPFVTRIGVASDVNYLYIYWLGKRNPEYDNCTS